MTVHVEPLALPGGSTDVLRLYAREIAIERTRLLYLGSRTPTLLMLLGGVTSACLVWGKVSSWLLGGWLVWLVLLAVLRLLQVAAFQQADSCRQASRHWRRTFLCGAGASGLTLAFAVIMLVPADAFLQQVLVFGLVAAAILSASVAYAVSLPAFLTFALPGLLPSIVFLLLQPHSLLQGWGVLGLILLVALLVVAGQIHRLVQGALLRRFQTQALNLHLERVNAEAEALNRKLAQEVGQRRLVERELRAARDALQRRVEARTEELGATSQALSQSEARLAMALEASELGLWDWDLESGRVQHSYLEAVFSDAGDGPEDYRRLIESIHPGDLPRIRRALAEHLKGRSELYRVEYRVRDREGGWRWLEDRGRAMARDPRGRVTRMLGTRSDISARKRLEEQQQLAATVFEAARQIRAELRQHGQWQGELVDTRKNGDPYPQWLQLNLLRDGNGEATHIVGFFTDLSARRDVEERLRHLLHYDELTGLANRRLFRERLHEAAQRARQEEGGLALLLIDLDRFKLLNDSLGHEVADQLLREMAQRLRRTAPEANTLARLAGDEFAILLDGGTGTAALSRLAERLLVQLRQPVSVLGHELILGASLGISLFSEQAREISVLMSQANLAMQHAKQLGGNTFQFFRDNLQDSTLERLRLETRLRKAVEEGQLDVHYQPKLCLASARPDSVEALVRWHHPEEGMIPPSTFIGLAEECGLIGEIGEFVLRRACLQAAEWSQRGLNLRVSVNLSVHQLRQGDLLDVVRSALADSGLPAAQLELELTESQWLDALDSVLATFRQLREMGVKLSVDDFGTGYSSLSYLKRLPLDYLKIDQSFVRDLTQNSEDAAIIRAIIAMAHSLDLKVVAEGVETIEQRDFLVAQRCDELQGYLIGRPLPAHALEEGLRQAR
ncbi:putative bifunctional diguanylate cyclase/phosphodiesterase [Pseudomonas aeruginosa]|uniref:putative bifunctional diguanylate cyclase/phosphodiesterase n=1 Tax=Pseudomonas aeruginosa TaxID=287 RepID=UPI0007AED305|nr:GGDEF and EAL domain-containing protein [Pseudomonas aeruginosa]KZM16998.1 diguanylate cyclase [Pseudomonas aeruginosa]